MNIKVLTHEIRSYDGHVMPSWINASSTNESRRIVEDVKNGLYDRETGISNIGTIYVRMRQSPKSKHEKSCKIDSQSWNPSGKVW